MPLPSSDYVAFQGLETIFNDKDLGIALSGGYVDFYSWVDQTTDKDVYIQTRIPDNDYTFTNAGSRIYLNAAGAFSNPADGTDVQIYGYVYSGSPAEPANRIPELYHLKVYSADNILQFTRDAVPANAFGGGGSSGESDILSENMISNPQFAQVTFATPSTVFNVTGSSYVTTIAPDWDMITTGTGTVTVLQNPITSLPLDGNPPFVLGILSSGLTDSSIILRQRFQGSPRLFLNSIVNGSLLVRSAIPIAIPFTMKYFPLSGDLSSVITIIAAVPSNDDGSYSTISNSVATTNIESDPSAAPTGYSEIQISFPAETQVYISNVQFLEVAEIAVAPDPFPAFEQETYARQVDHLYHYAYPIVPIGTIIDFFGFDTPLHYLLCDYTAYSRVAYYELFNTITTTETVSLTNTVATFTVASSDNYRIGMGLEGTGIPAFATITDVTGLTITMSRGATSTVSTSVRFFAAANRVYETVTLTTGAGTNQFTVADGTLYAVGMSITGNGIPAFTTITVIAANLITMSNNATIDGSSVISFYFVGNGDTTTTFNVPDARRRTMMGSGGTIISGSTSNGFGIGNKIGDVGGQESHLQVLSELVEHKHDPLAGAAFWMSTATPPNTAGGGSGLTAQVTTGGVTGFTTQTASNIIQSALITNKCIRYQ